MNVKELVELLSNLPQDFEATFLCPDGYEDAITNNFEVDRDNGVIRFRSYIHRERKRDD